MAQATIPPRVAAVHDLSCLGRCALTAVIPVLSALGAQVGPVPTALLSTQTDGFDGLFFRDLDREMDEITDHFSRLGLSFDAIYSGFLGNVEQIERVIALTEKFPSRLVMIDPVMGDDGALYQTFTPELAVGMKRLSGHADLITPNYTEACFLTDTPYRPTDDMDESALDALLADLMGKLLALGPRCVVITGIVTGNKVRTIATDGESRFVCDRPRLAARYPGTGDIFAATLLGKLLSGKDFRASVEEACAFVSHTIAYTLSAPETPRREGVLLEGCLKELIGRN